MTPTCTCAPDAYHRRPRGGGWTMTTNDRPLLIAVLDLFEHDRTRTLPTVSAKLNVSRAGALSALVHLERTGYLVRKRSDPHAESGSGPGPGVASGTGPPAWTRPTDVEG